MASATVTTTSPHDDAGESLERSTVGMWVFLASEVMFFGAVFTAYLVYRTIYPEIFAEASRELDVVIGAANTAILLTSSFTVALAVRAAQSGKRNALVAFLTATILLGLGFLGLKALEYAHEFARNLFPGGNFIYPGSDPQKARLFFSLYFTMTGLHAVHVATGITALTILAILAWRKKFSAQHYEPVELVGLFWHFIDIVWIFLFPLLYLINRAK